LADAGSISNRRRSPCRSAQLSFARTRIASLCFYRQQQNPHILSNQLGLLAVVRVRDEAFYARRAKNSAIIHFAMFRKSTKIR
jgi:hypothetical protein